MKLTNYIKLKLDYYNLTATRCDLSITTTLGTECAQYTERFGILKVVHFLWTTHDNNSSIFTAILQLLGVV